MSASVFLFLAVSGNIYIATDQTSFNVSQSPKEAMVSKGENVTFYCVFPISQDESWVKVYWWKQGENEYQRTSTGSRKRSGRRGKRTWYFELQNVMIQDSGMYLCSLTRKGLPARNGTGSLLKVYVVPTPLKMFVKKHSTTAFIIVCETAGFYPEDFSLTWYKNDVEIVLGSSGKSLFVWILRCAMGVLTILVLMIVIGTRCRKQQRKGNEECFTEANRSEVCSCVHIAPYNLVIQ
ncbi:signal-regulatory protein beta-1-like isoform X4 [Hypanus sabinus]|uniref:signal-regulatory protein beta-1-like isoform X4 n=1 Tax=Hypanus sabinus TaxID=79690 RepID=UPI0028C4ADB3|nr:signal-regulatory protein beta-1-like isoform X4 [Hypanus sabinus]